MTSHADGLTAQGYFDNVTFTGDAPPPSWTSQTVGDMPFDGHHALVNGVHTMNARGADVWDTTDAFQYAYQRLTGDGSIVARLTSLTAPHPWTKAGVMIRASTDPSSAHAYMFLSRDNGLAFQRRTESGQTTTHTRGGPGAVPVWLRLTRSGPIVTAATSIDGVTWTEVGSDALAIGDEPVLVGLAVTSHDNSESAYASLDNVRVEP